MSTLRPTLTNAEFSSSSSRFSGDELGAAALKIIQRSEYQGAVERNKENILANPQLYQQRQALVEHPFGTMKRQWGFDHIMTKKTKARASADVGFIFIAYNLRRIINIVGKKPLMAFLKACLATYLSLKSKIKLKISLGEHLKLNWNEIRKIRMPTHWNFKTGQWRLLSIVYPAF